jgi:hypothetical protein
VGGGQLLAHGSMWVSPAAENHPSAIRMHLSGEQLDAGRLAAHYLAEDLLAQLPPGTLSGLGPTRVVGTMSGPHTGPAVQLVYDLPPSSHLVSGGSASFTPRALTINARGPVMSLSATAHVSTPGVASLRAADTQVGAQGVAGSG